MDTDRVAIARSLGGEPEAFADVVRRHSVAIHSYLARRGGRELADDLSADVWVRAFGSRATYDPLRAEPLTWLYGIARNALLAQWRQRPERLMWAGESNDLWSEVDARLDAGRQRLAILAALETLNPDDRELFLLIAWEQLSPTEAANVLGIPAGTARSRLHRARTQLRTHLLATGDERQSPFKEIPWPPTK